MTLTLKMANTINLQIQYITDENGEKTAVILPIDQFETLLKNIQLQPNDEVKNQELTNKNIWEIAQEITEEITEDELQLLPHDGAQQHDHYIYGIPKK
jgi:CHAT domain-containing protein